MSSLRSLVRALAVAAVASAPALAQQASIRLHGTPLPNETTTAWSRRFAEGTPMYVECWVAKQDLR